MCVCIKSTITLSFFRITQHYLISILENGEAVQSLKKEIPNFDIILIQVCIYVYYYIHIVKQLMNKIHVYVL